jgi:hypothetical protein
LLIILSGKNRSTYPLKKNHKESPDLKYCVNLFSNNALCGFGGLYP